MEADGLEDTRHLEVMSFGTCLQVEGVCVVGVAGGVFGLEITGFRSVLCKCAAEKEALDDKRGQRDGSSGEAD